MPPPHLLALICDDERLSKLLSWQLMSERTEISTQRLLAPEGDAQGAVSSLSYGSLELEGVELIILCLRSHAALVAALQQARAHQLPALVCSPEPSIEEATLCLRGGAADYLDRPWRGAEALTEQVIELITRHRSHEWRSPPSAQERPEAPPLMSLINTSLSFQEALTPIEDELRRLYLTELLREVGSVNGAAKRAGVDRSNFKRLLKRYHVTRQGEPR